ncbi:hypothetical protein L0N21_18490, partial [Fusicatenibacter saccharivorans]
TYGTYSGVEDGNFILPENGKVPEQGLHGGTGVLQCIDVYGRNVLMEQKEPVLVLYDREEEYARLFSEYLKRQK